MKEQEHLELLKKELERLQELYNKTRSVGELRSLRSRISQLRHHIEKIEAVLMKVN